LRKLTLNSFRRITQNGSFIPEVDGLRFIAIISVVLIHSYTEVLNRIERGIALGATATQTAPLPVDPSNPHGFLRFLGHGGYGVQLFFAISGFILAWPFARQRLQAGQKVGLGSYFLRRVTRLEPPYILMLVFRAVLLLAIGIQQARSILVHLIVSIFYLHNIVFAIASKIEAVSWTLEIEVQFYCLAPLLTLIYKIPRAWLRRTLLICAIASAAPLQQAFLSRWSGARFVGAFNLSILAFVQFFLVGLLVADLYVDGWNRIPHTLWWDLISVPLWVFMFWFQPRTFEFVGPLVLPILFVGAFKGVFIPRFLRNPFVTTIGGMCYSIYLTHRTAILMLQLLLVRFHLHFFSWLVISLFLVAPAAIAVGAIYFRLIERPCMNPRWPQELIERFSPRTNTSPELDTCTRPLGRNTLS
jgi:peptidoglycan/LPS O-acetylase OafA/YrhL